MLGTTHNFSESFGGDAVGMLSVQAQIQVKLYRLKDKVGKMATTPQKCWSFSQRPARWNTSFVLAARCYTTFMPNLRAATSYCHSQLRAGTLYLFG
jgi:hypothetical protein